MFELIQPGLCRKTGNPKFGKQDLGISPAGPMDLFSFQTGNLILANPSDAESLEIIIPPEVRFTKTCFTVITGGAFEHIRLISEETEQEVDHATVFLASAGSTLRFGPRKYGFRSYLSCRPIDAAGSSPMGHQLPPFREIAEWAEKDNTIRIIQGPEYRYLDHPEYFSNHPWKISNDFNNMGMRLTCLRQMPSVSLANMISGAVADGTVQLTPNGPIILLRHRQTVGGYPRIFNVISADIDTLGQFQPGQIIHFRQVDTSEARRLSRIKNAVLARLKARWSD